MKARSRLLTLLAALYVVAAWSPEICLAQTTKPYQREPDRTNLTPDQKKAETFVAKLLGRAQQSIAVHDYPAAIRRYEEALEALEGVYGPGHERLVEVLNAIVDARFAIRSGLGAALKAQERIVKIYDGRDDLNPEERVEEIVKLGDVYLYLDDKRAMDTYSNAWRLRARLVSAESADALFASTAFVRLELPPNPLGHGKWSVTVHYDVHADGRVVVSDVTGDASQSLKNGVRRKYGDARFRPRLVGGEPVETLGISFTHPYLATFR